MNDYERVARVIRFLDQRHLQQPDLAALAKCAGLSPSHFHRLFCRWAGVTPKDFLQCLTLAHVKGLLRQRLNVLDAALESGLSGPSRLHDLCVTLAGATPGEMKSGGAGWTLTCGFSTSPFGKCLIAQSPRGVCHLAFVQPGRQRAAWSRLQRDWPKARLRRDDSAAHALRQRIFSLAAKPPAGAPLRAFVRGTPFQVQVWQALMKIPLGQVTSYGRLAASLGRPSAARAVGAAVGRNRLAYLIPCHRVIRETGVVGDYHWGSERKRIMVAWESGFQGSFDAR